MTRQPLFVVRDSPVHGLGAFALRRIGKGTRIVEYLGERVSHREADRRYESKDANDAHTFLFIVDSKTVIDAGVGGNEARFLNHSCNPNCESVIEKRRVFIEAIRTIEPGEEMTYDYQIQREDDDPPGIEEIFACHCGFPQCRGTMLWPPDAPRATRRKPKRKPRSTQQTRQARPARRDGSRGDGGIASRGRKTERAGGTARKASRRR
jgi:SET domain-containing protein